MNALSIVLLIVFCLTFIFWGVAYTENSVEKFLSSPKLPQAEDGALKH